MKERGIIGEILSIVYDWLMERTNISQPVAVLINALVCGVVAYFLADWFIRIVILVAEKFI